MSSEDDAIVDATNADEIQVELSESGVWRDSGHSGQPESPDVAIYCSELDEDDGYNPQLPQYKKVNSIFSSRGGLKSLTKYNLWVIPEERSYIHHLYFGAVWFLMPYGAKGALGMDKRLRARAINYGWRPALNACRKASVNVNGTFVPINCSECKHLMVKVSQPLPYSSWKSDRIPVCNSCEDEIILEIDQFYYHCPAKRCGVACESCVNETKVDPETLDSDDENNGTVGNDDDYDVTVCDCVHVCKGNLCIACAKRQAYEKSSGNPLGKQPSMRNSSKKSSSKELKLYSNTPSSRHHHKMTELKIIDEGDEETGSPAVSPDARFARSVPMDGVSPNQRRMSMECFLAKDKTMSEYLLELFENIEKDPKYYFPTLDFYILAGLKKEQSIVQRLFILLILLAQVAIPILLMYSVKDDLAYSYSGLLDMGDSDSTAAERAAACVNVALQALDYQSMTNAKYSKQVVCDTDTMSGSLCTDYYCNFQVDTVCNRDSNFSRKACGFLLILILCILTMKSFYDAANSFVFAASSAVSLATRRQQHDNGEIDNATRGEEKVKEINEYWENEKMNIFLKSRYILPLVFCEVIPFYLLKGCVKITYEFMDFLYKCCCQSRRDKSKKVKEFHAGNTNSIDSRVSATVDHIYESTFNLMTHLFTTSLSRKYPPHKQMKYVVHYVSQGKLPVPYELLNFLHKIDPDLCPIHPTYVLFSIFVNFISMGLTLAASLYVTVQSKKLSDIVLNTLALQFLITLDESTLNKDEAQSAILHSCSEARRLLKDMVHVHLASQEQKESPRRPSVQGDGSRRQSLVDLKNDRKYTKPVLLVNKLKHQINIDHRMYSWFNSVLYNSISTGYFAIWEFFKPDKRRYKDLSCPYMYLQGIQDLFMTIFLYCCWMAAMICLSFIWAWVGIFVIFPVTIPFALIIATGVLTAYGVKCI